MNLADERLRELDNPSLTADGRAALRAQVAADLTHKGQYEAAREALGELWRGTGQRPNVGGLSEKTAAEVLLQAGVLSGWIGKAKGAQDAAKDLISESAALFEKLGESNRAAAARAEIALCYWREGAYAEARVMLEEAAAIITDDASLKAKTVLRFAIMETAAGRYSDALQLLTNSAPLFDEGVSHTLRGSFHNELARVLRVSARPNAERITTTGRSSNTRRPSTTRSRRSTKDTSRASKTILRFFSTSSGATRTRTNTLTGRRLFLPVCVTRGVWRR